MKLTAVLYGIVSPDDIEEANEAFNRNRKRSVKVGVSPSKRLTIVSIPLIDPYDWYLYPSAPGNYTANIYTSLIEHIVNE